MKQKWKTNILCSFISSIKDLISNIEYSFSFDYRKGELIITYIGILENLIKYKKKKTLMTGVFWSTWRVAIKIQTIYTNIKNFVFKTKWMQKYN